MGVHVCGIDCLGGDCNNPTSCERAKARPNVTTLHSGASVPGNGPKNVSMHVTLQCNLQFDFLHPPPPCRPVGRQQSSSCWLHKFMDPIDSNIVGALLIYIYVCVCVRVCRWQAKRVCWVYWMCVCCQCLHCIGVFTLLHLTNSNCNYTPECRPLRSLLSTHLSSCVLQLLNNDLCWLFVVCQF